MAAPDDDGESTTGWRTVLACAAGAWSAMTGQAFYSFGLFVKPLSQTFGWTRGKVGLGLSFITLGLLIFTAPTGALTDRFGVRRVALPSLAGAAVGYAGLSFVGSTVASFCLACFRMGMTVCPAVLAPLLGVAWGFWRFSASPSSASLSHQGALWPQYLKSPQWSSAARRRLYYLAVNLLGLFIGPIAVLPAASVLPRYSLGSAIGVTAGLATLIGAAGVVVALSPFRRVVDTLSLAQGGVSSADLAR